MPLTIFTFLLTSYFATHACAHGYVSNVTIGGTMYPGNAPGRYACMFQFQGPLPCQLTELARTRSCEPNSHGSYGRPSDERLRYRPRLRVRRTHRARRRARIPREPNQLHVGLRERGERAYPSFTCAVHRCPVKLTLRMTVVAARGRAGPDVHGDVRERDDVRGVRRVGRGVVQDRGGREAGGKYVVGPAAYQSVWFGSGMFRVRVLMVGV